MDEGTLNDLLECSVCLERLDTSSKVLPCQHTFCTKCLQEIVDSHKELRCPECRILVLCKVDDLPPNVLLMRILEGMRNAAPKKQQYPIKDPHIMPIIQPVPPANHGPGTPDQRHKSNKTNLYHLPFQQPYAKALYDFASKEPGDLSFKRGEVVIIRKKVDSYWYEGECGGKRGVFPLSYVQIITPVPSNSPQCKALYEFRMANDEEEGCLTFNKGDIISVIRRVDENWAEGKLEGRIGIFPLAFVELNCLARSLMKLSTNAQPGPSRVAPPTPTTEDSVPLIPTDHSKNVGSTVIGHVGQCNISKHGKENPIDGNLPTSDSSSTLSSGGSSTTTTPNTSSSNTSSTSSTAPSSPASPPQRMKATSNIATGKHDQTSVSPRIPNTSNRLETHTFQHNREKRHSFTSIAPLHHLPSTNRHSAEILNFDIDQAVTPESIRHNEIHSNTAVLPAMYIALYPYKPQKPDELELRKGCIYLVTDQCQDGWFKGASNRTQKCGVFPGNYVAPANNVSRNARSQSNESRGAPSFTRSNRTSPRATNVPPELPPRSTSPASSISSSWHGQQENTAVSLGRSSSAIMSSISSNATPTKATEKVKERKEKTTVSLMKRLTSITRSKSPPPSYSLDNPVFEDTSVPTSHPVHSRSGSCPSQLLHLQPGEHHKIFQTTSQRLKHRERPSIINQSAGTRGADGQPGGSCSPKPNVNLHRKSNSLDAGSKSKTTQTIRERFRCIAPYPPNSEYELELQVNDIIYVHKKREDGWYKGTQQRTGRTGLFPANFVDNY